MNSREHQIADLKKQLSDLSGRMEDFASTAEEAATGYLHDMKDVPAALKDGLDSAKESVKKAGGQVQDYAKENPWHVAGIAAAVGFLIAMASRRRD